METAVEVDLCGCGFEKEGGGGEKKIKFEMQEKETQE